MGASWGPLGGLLRASWGPLGPSQGPPRGFVGPRARDFVSCSPSGPLLGPSWAPLGPSWMPLGQSWSPLGPSWGPLGSLLGPLGAILEASWAVLGRREAEKVETPKSAQNLRKNNECCLLGVLLEASWSVWGPSWASWSVLVASRITLEPSWGALGGLLAASWPLLGLSGRPRGRRPGGKPSLT